jgi:hypothetical protein
VADKFKYRAYISHTNFGVIPSYWIKQFDDRKQFCPSLSSIGKLIYPSVSYKFYLLLIIESYQDTVKYKDLSVRIDFKANFSNG